MEIRRWLCYILIKCVVIQYRSAKSISLNEIIAAESQQNQVSDKPQLPGLSGLRAKSISLNEIISSESQENRESNNFHRIKFPELAEHSFLFKRLRTQGKTDNAISRDTKISPLKYRKAFRIKSPLKPKKLKLTLKSKRKNQSIKREISGNESLKEKYIPLLKSLSMLFDNLLNSDESESFEIKAGKYKRNRFYSEEQFEVPCNCSDKPSIGNAKPNAYTKTITPAPTIFSKISSDTEGLTFSSNYDDSTYRPHKSIPVLLPRNTFSRRRNNYGSSKRSSSSYNRNLEGNIPRDYGDYEHYTGRGEDKSYAKSDENFTDNVTRDDPSSAGYSRRSRKRNNTANSQNRKRVANFTENEIYKDTIGKYKFEIGRNKTESKKLLREPIRRLRGFVSDEKINDEGLIPERVQPKEVREESVLSIAYNSTSHKRIVNESGPLTTEDEKIRPRNETVILIERNSHNNGNYSNSTGKKAPVVLIFDGYSVTRDKNGENKVSGKTIHIRS